MEEELKLIEEIVEADCAGSTRPLHTFRGANGYLL